MTTDDRLIVWGGRGRLTLAETAASSPGRFKKLAERRPLFSADVWPHVLLANGRLYCKDCKGNLKCLDL